MSHLRGTGETELLKHIQSYSPFHIFYLHTSLGAPSYLHFVPPHGTLDVFEAPVTRNSCRTESIL